MLDIIGRVLTTIFVVGILVSLGRKVGAGNALYPGMAGAAFGVLLLAAHEWLSRRGNEPRQVLPGLGVLALAASIVFLAAALFQTTKPPRKPRLTASTPLIAGEYPQAPDPGPSPKSLPGKSQPSSGAAKAPPLSHAEQDIPTETGSSHACSSCTQGPHSQPGKTPGRSDESIRSQETQAGIAKAKEESSEALSTKTDTPGGGGSAEVKGGSSSSGEIRGGSGSIRSESKSSSSASSTSTENGATQSAHTESTSERKTESNTTGVPTG
jgi:hypothetical protein